MTVSRMRAIINRVPLPPGRHEPVLPTFHPQVVSVANTFDTYAYTASAIIRPVHFAGASNPSLLPPLSTALQGIDAGRSTGGLLGYVALPLNARHEWQRAGVRDMHRGRLLAEAIGEAYGINYAWQAAQTAARAVVTAVSGVLTHFLSAISGIRRPTTDVEAQRERQQETRL